MPCLALTPSGDVAVPLRRVYGIDVVAVRVSIRLRTFLGEWLSDTAFGLPWQAWIDGTGPTTLNAAALVRAQLEDTPGVIRVLSCNATLLNRVVTVTAQVLASADDDTGIVNVQGQLNPWDTSGAPAWYMYATPARGRP